MNKLYIVRHGQTEWNAKGIIQGNSDIELNELGKRQAYELASKLDLSDIDICICSPLKRARQTADILVNNKIDIIYDESIVERGFGNYEGKSIEADFIYKQWNYELNDSSEGMESVKDSLLRAKKFLYKVKKEYPNKNILIVSHACFIKVLHYNIEGYDENTDFLSFSPKNAELYVYNLD